MNILLIANELRYTCGVTNHLLHLSRGLSEDGAKKIYILCGGGNGVERFEGINVKVTENDRFNHKDRSYLKYLSAVRFLKNFISENKIDIIHSHNHYAANIARAAAKNSGLKTIQTNHGLLAPEGRLKHFNADKFIAINEHIYEYIINNKIASAENVSFIRCGIPVPSDPPVKNNTKIKIIAASRFTKEKGLDIFINAISQLPDPVKGKAEFYIAGEGELQNDLQRLNESLNAGIIFPGNVKEMYPLLAETNIFIFPSSSDHEGFPAVITEAGANNNLVITSDFSALGDIIENKKDGLIFERENFTQLAKILNKVIENPEEFKAMSLNFYNKIKKLFSINEMIQKHSKLYEECLS